MKNTILHGFARLIKKPPCKITNSERLQSFSFFLAGLIDSDGHFSKIPQLVIAFDEKDVSVAYYIKKKIGFGIVSKIKKKQAVTYVLAHRAGLEKVSTLIIHKLRHKAKIEQFNQRLVSLSVEGFQPTLRPDSHPPLQERVKVNLISSIPDTSWFSGFFFGDGSFQIKILDRIGRKNPEVRLVIQIDQKENYLLEEIKFFFGGSIGFRKSQNTYHYSSVSFRCAGKVVAYFDRYPLIGRKQTQYLLWRKVFLGILEGVHLTPEGVRWIRNVKERISFLARRVETCQK